MTSPRPIVVLATVALAVPGLVLAALLRPEGPTQVPSPGPGRGTVHASGSSVHAPRPAASTPTELAGLAVLRAWDRRRAAAYASGSAASLRELYVPGAPAGRADLRTLAGYTSRGLRVTGMRMQVLAVRVLRHEPGRWRLRVTDRLVGAVAVTRGGRVVLPRDRASAHTVTVRRGGDGHWRVAAVR